MHKSRGEKKIFLKLHFKSFMWILKILISLYTLILWSMDVSEIRHVSFFTLVGVNTHMTHVWQFRQVSRKQILKFIVTLINM